MEEVVTDMPCIHVDSPPHGLMVQTVITCRTLQMQLPLPADILNNI